MKATKLTKALLTTGSETQKAFFVLSGGALTAQRIVEKSLTFAQLRQRSVQLTGVRALTKPVQQQN